MAPSAKENGSITGQNTHHNFLSRGGGSCVDKQNKVLVYQHI